MADHPPSAAPRAPLSSRFVRGAGEVPDGQLWGPARWVVQLIQYLVALVIVTVGEGLKYIFKGERPPKKNRATLESKTA